MENKFYYCAFCDVEMKGKELNGVNCPYCDTEIPDAAEEMKNRATD